MRSAAKIKAKYKRYLQRSGKVERAQVSADGGLADPWRTISCSVSVEQQQDKGEYITEDRETIRVWVYRDQDDEDVGGIRDLTRDYQLKRDPTFDANQTPFTFNGTIVEQGRDYQVGEFDRATPQFVGQGGA